MSLFRSARFRRRRVLADEALKTEIEFNAKPTQTSFITSRAQADLFSCRMGEGKSAALCWAIFYHTQHNPGAQWALIRDTWENLQATTLLEFFKWFPKGVMIDWSASQKRATWRRESGLEGSVVCVGMDVPGDAHKLQSRELAGFAMDEPAPAAEGGGISEMIFSTAMTRLRQPGMNWYSAKLAQNSSDETHWTYRTFFDPGRPANPNAVLPKLQSSGYRVFQTTEPENLSNLPPGYYEDMRERYRESGRTDLADRFAEGRVGFQQPGKAVTPEFSQTNHVTPGLQPISQAPLSLCWDFGGNPTCLFTQQTPMGHWNVLEAHVSDGGMGVFELIEEVIAGRIKKNFHGAEIFHYGDPAGDQIEGSSSSATAVRKLRDMLGGRWYPGPQKWDPRIQPLRRVLTTMRNGTGLVQIDEHEAKPLWHALRGGWFYRIGQNGVSADRPVKNIHSHPGDAFSYGAAEMFPGGVLRERGTNSGFVQHTKPTYRRVRTPVETMFNAIEGEVPEDGEAMIEQPSTPNKTRSYMRPRAIGRRR